MKLPIAILVLVAALAVPARADQLIQNAQQALKDQGFYYGEVTGEKNADTTAAIRRYQIRNGLQITGDLNDETLKSLGVDSSGVHPTVKASPTVAPAQQTAPPDTLDLRQERRENAGPTNPLTGQPFPEQPQDRQPPAQPDYGAVPGHPAENFAGTPLQSAPPQVQRDVIVSAQNILARQGLYRGMIDGIAGPDLEFSLRAYQSRVRLPVTGRLDLETLAALQLLPGGNAPIYLPRRRPSTEAPVRGEWIPDRN
jgi:peptidoglycan hydrolase-like protein with peptidoglycan-binding domain